MLHAARKILEYAEGVTESGFKASSLHQDAILRQLTILGEAAKRISSEFRAQHPEVPWRRIAGFRDIVVHDYLFVNLEEVWRIVREDVPSLVDVLPSLMPLDQE
jgi:uncharacterized protein with HEPN domain